jgi:hypothetical protein
MRDKKKVAEVSGEAAEGKIMQAIAGSTS